MLLVPWLSLLIGGCARFGYDLIPLADDNEMPDGPSCDGCPVSSVATCSDAIQNQNEAAVDCGGPCPACDAGATATCSDAIQNQNETAVDCGGPCPACDAGPLATCSDAIQNQNETAVDCGGPSCTPCIPTSCSQVVADSSADFSGVQGQAGWYYGYYVEPNFSSAAFIQLPDYRYGASVGEVGWFGTNAWTWIGSVRMHPNGRITSGGKFPIEQHAVRRWISTTSEPLFVQGSLRSTNTLSSGIIGRILVGDVEVWQRSVPPRENGPNPFELVITVQAGDAVNFTLDPYLSNDGADDTEFSVKLCR